MPVSSAACWTCFWIAVVSLAVTMVAMIFDWQAVSAVTIWTMGLSWLALAALLFVDAQAPR